MKYTDIINQCAEVAGYLWQKGWAERNGGNLVVNLYDSVDESLQQLPPLSAPIAIGVEVPHLSGYYFYCKGANKRMRNLARSPMDNGSIVRVTADGLHYEIVACKPICPTSEITAHLALHNHLVASGSSHRATLHTHPTEIVALSHRDELLEGDRLTQTLWSMIPEARLFCTRGIGIVPYCEPGSVALAEETLAQLSNHDLVLWEKHGVIAVGTDIIEAFDTIDVMNKAAQIYLLAR